MVTSEQNSTPAAPPTAPVPPARERARHRCAFCSKEAREPKLFGSVRPAIAKLMSAEHPNLTAGDTICGRHVSDYRTRFVAGLLERERGELSELEHQVVESLAHEETTRLNVEAAWDKRRSVGEKVADVVADFGGS